MKKFFLHGITLKKRIKNIFVTRFLTLKILNNSKFYMGPTIKNWLFPYISFEREQYSIFNILLLIKRLREMLYLVYIHSYIKNLIVIHSSNSPENIFTHIAYGFAGAWANGFLTNFKWLMRRQLLKKTLDISGEQNIPTLQATKVAYLPSLAIDLGKTTHGFIVESFTLGLNCIFTIDNNVDPRNYYTDVLAFNTSICAVETLSLLIRETIYNAKLDDFFFFIKRFYMTYNKKHYKRISYNQIKKNENNK